LPQRGDGFHFVQPILRATGLVEFFAAKRLELAAKVDHGQLTEQQFTLEADKAYANIQDTERQRDMAAKQK
jgi:hypothetical protein